MPLASAANRSYGYASTYSTSYGSGTSYLPRSSSNRESSFSPSGYSASKQANLRSRPLPSGPGPLDSDGRKLTHYNVSSTLDKRIRTPTDTIGRTGPLKATHPSAFSSSSKYTSDYGRYTSNVGTVRRTSASRFDSNEINDIVTTTRVRPRSSSAQPNKSSSLINLSELSLDSNAAAPRARGGSIYNNNSHLSGEVNTNTSVRNRIYRDTNRNDDIFQGKNHSSPAFEDIRPDGTSRTGYTPSMSRETSPVNSHAPQKRMSLVGDRGDSPPKSSLSIQSSTSSMSNGVLSKYRDGGKVGLRNLGNTCFMNSVLQCLSNTKLLLEFCLEDKYQTEINHTTSNMKGALIKAYVNLMTSMWKDKNDSYVSPNAFKTQVQKFAPRFMGYSQQDSQEFLRYLLEGLHEDVNRVTKKPAPIILDDDALEKKSDSGKAQEYWKAYLNRDNSQIVDIFVGQLKSELKFTSCSHRSVTFDPFWDLSLPIPKNRQDVNIEDCIRLFMREEELAAEERPNCSKCKQRRSCTKSFSIQKFPKILVLHLKRFSQERYGRKLSTFVDFPVKGLDLSDYSGDGGSGRKVLYDLYAVSNHSGGTSSGHYTAICKNPYTTEWNFFNDNRVTITSSNKSKSSEAYVLFYELSSQTGRA